jgi:hypothetical protein
MQVVASQDMWYDFEVVEELGFFGLDSFVVECRCLIEERFLTTNLQSLFCLQH